MTIILCSESLIEVSLSGRTPSRGLITTSLIGTQALLDEANHTILPPLVSSYQDLLYATAFNQDAAMLPYYLRMEEALATVNILSRTKSTATRLPPSSKLRNLLQSHLPCYHETHPNSISFFLTINMPQDCSLVESYLKAAIITKKLHNIPKEISRTWKKAYIVTGNLVWSTAKSRYSPNIGMSPNNICGGNMHNILNKSHPQV